MVEHFLAKEDVEGSNPFSRSSYFVSLIQRKLSIWHNADNLRDRLWKRSVERNDPSGLKWTRMGASINLKSQFLMTLLSFNLNRTSTVVGGSAS